MTKFKKRMIAMACMSPLGFFSTALQASEPTVTDAVLPTVKISGILPDRLESVPGSFAVLNEQELEQRLPFSVKEALNSIPGVHIVGEDSFGLGLNIGMRGLNPRRSSRTLLLEDGMPLFLAPYGDPSAHYSTPLDRVRRIEVIKGSGQVLYGPQTIGGMINFVTRPVPTNGLAGSVSATVGNNDFKGLHANVGVGGERGGIMLDALKKRGDGVRKNHDFDVQEITIKGQLNLTERHTLTAKLGLYEEDSQISETALGAVEWQEDKFQAPTGMNDVFKHERIGLQLQHIFEINDQSKLSTQFYHAQSERVSFRQINNPGENAGRSRLERCTFGVDNNDLSNAHLCGGRWRPREHNYWGIEPRLDFRHQLFGIDSEAVVGLRYHAEDINRKQFRGNTAEFQNLSFAKDNSLPRELVDIEVKAKSYYAQNTFFLGDWSLTPGLRLEDVLIKTDVKRADGDAHSNPEARLTNRFNEVLPGIGIAWHAIPDTTVFAGLHKGFAPPRPDRDIDANGPNTAVVSKTKPEKSTNWELGIRSKSISGLALEATLFNTVFDEIVIQGAPGTFVNGGRSQQAGVELASRIDFGKVHGTAQNIYMTGAYTNLFTAKFRKDDVTQGIRSGNRLPYAPRHLASLSLGYQHPIGLDARIGFDYVSRQFSDGANTRVENLRGTEGIIASHTLWNASISYTPPGENYTVFLSGHNLTNSAFLVSRVDGKVAGRGRQVFGGIRYGF